MFEYNSFSDIFMPQTIKARRIKLEFFSTNQCLPSEESCFDARCAEREIKHTPPESRIGFVKKLD